MPNHDYYIRHRDEILAYSKKYAESHRPQIRETVKRYKRNHRDKFNAYRRDYYARNRETLKNRAANYYLKNKEKINKFRRENFTKYKMPEQYERYAAASRYSAAKAYAKRKRKEFSIQKSDYMEYISKSCVYCSGTLPLHGIALDRIDNSKGYVIGNVEPCCTSCNRIRGDNLTVEEMKYVLKCLKEFRLKKVFEGVSIGD